MARRMLFPAGLMVLIVVLVLVHQSCSAEDDSHICPASSCGNIHNISYPFRLKDDPKHCGDPRYTLSCENGQTVLNLYDGKYYVREINYNYYTIRVADPGMDQKDNYSFIPRYLLGPHNFSVGDPYAPEYPYITGPCVLSCSCYSTNILYQKYMVFVNCEKQVKSPLYFDISSCFKNGGVVYSSNSFLSHSKRYTYVIASTTTQSSPMYDHQLNAVDMEESCQIEQKSLSTPIWQNNRVGYFGCTDFHDAVVSGFVLSWFQVACDSSRGYDCYINDYANYHHVRCDYVGAGGGISPPKLYLICLKVLVAVINNLVPKKIRDTFGVANAEFFIDKFGEVSVSKSCLKDNIEQPNKVEWDEFRGGASRSRGGKYPIGLPKFIFTQVNFPWLSRLPTRTRSLRGIFVG